MQRVGRGGSGRGNGTDGPGASKRKDLVGCVVNDDMSGGEELGTEQHAAVKWPDLEHGGEDCAVRVETEDEQSLHGHSGRGEDSISGLVGMDEKAAIDQEGLLWAS